MKKNLPLLIVLLVLIGIYFSPLRSTITGFFSKAKVESGLQMPVEKMETPIEGALEDFAMMSLEGKSINLKDLKGKVVFLNFWATWCPPCVAEMPSLQQLYNQYKTNTNIEFVFVSVDEDPSVIPAFMQKQGFQLPIYSPEQRIPDTFQTGGIPATFVIDKKGEIVLKEGGSRDWNTPDVKVLLDSLSQ